MKTSAKFFACIVAILGLASPILAQNTTQAPDAARQLPLYAGNSGYGNGETAAARIAALKQSIAKKTKADGGKLTQAHEQMLRVRLARILAEERLRTS